MSAEYELLKALLSGPWRRSCSPIALSWCRASSSTTRIMLVCFSHSVCFIYNMHLPRLTCIVVIYKHMFFSGTVSVSEWAQVLESVLRLDLPWRTLRPHLAHLAPDGRVEYQSCFEDMEPGIPLAQVRKVKGWKATKCGYSSASKDVRILTFLPFKEKYTFYSTTFFLMTAHSFVYIFFKS